MYVQPPATNRYFICIERHIFKCGAFKCHGNEYIIYITCIAPNDKYLSDITDDKCKYDRDLGHYSFQGGISISVLDFELKLLNKYVYIPPAIESTLTRTKDKSGSSFNVQYHSYYFWCMYIWSNTETFIGGFIDTQTLKNWQNGLII